MSLLLRLRTAAWLLLLAVAPVWAQQVEQQQDGSVVARTPLYEAVVRVDGYLHSLKVAGTELLDDRVSFSKGIYLHNQTRQVFKMAAPQVNGTTVTASGEVATLTYSFRPDGLDVSVESTTSGNLYGVFSNAVKRLRNQQTGAEVAAPGALTASDVTLLTDGPWLRAVGGNRLWGPWPTAAEPRQVLERTFAAGQRQQLAFTVGGQAAPPAPAAPAPAAPIAGAATVASQPDGSVQAKGQTYQAVVQADGYLHSLKVGGVEMLDDKVGFSRGSYFYSNNQVPALGRPQVTGHQVVAEGPAGKLTYTFLADRIQVHVEPQIRGNYFYVLSSNVAQMRDTASGREVAAPAGMASGDVRMLAGGPWLQMIGGSSQWGPWEGRQVFDRGVEVGKSYDLTLIAGGEASAANLVTLDVTTTDSDYITSADTRLPFLIRVRSGGDQPFEGKLTATLHDYETRQEVDRTELPLTAPAGGSGGAVLPLGREQAGWYDAKLQLSGQCGGQAINLTKEFTIGVDPAKAVPPLYRPADLKEFWAKTLQELAARPMNARLTPMESLSTDRAAVYKLQLQGLVDEPFFAWYVHPKKPGKHPATLLVPGYGDHGIGNPRGLAEAGICAVSIQVRHTDVDLPKYEGKPYMTLGIDSPETYVYRDIYCMGVRAIDFLLSRPEVDPEKVMVQGMSQGGGLSIATAALDPRVRLAAAEVPFLCDYPEALKVASYPYGEIRNYLNEHPERREQVLRTLSYFDGMNLAPEIRCPVVMTVGLRDRVCPPPTVWAAYHYVTAPKQIFVYPAMGHAVSSEFGQAREQWARTLMPLP